ncbi:MAG: hypothetical protein WEB02_06485 [Methylophaga sp.]
MVELALNNPESEEFVQNIGKFIANFGVIELTIIEICDVLSKDPVLTKLAHRSLLSRRVDILKEQIKRSSVAEETKNALLNHLKELKPFIELRNILAHNPITFVFPNADPSQEASIAGILNMRPKDKTKDGEIISIEELRGGVNDTSKIARKLREDLDAIQKVNS